MTIVYQSFQSAQPLLSVIIMFKNEEQTLPVALDSLNRQETDSPWEVIFIDGCSSDNSVELIKQHPVCAKASVTIMTQPADNHGMTVAQNLGARMARAPYLVFMQADVRIRDPRALQKVADAFKEPGVVGTYFTGLGAGDDFYKYDFWGQVFLSRYQGDRVEHDFDTKFNGVRADVFRKLGGFDEKHLPLGGNDFEFESRLRREGRIVDTHVEVEHLHAFGKRHTAWGLIKKYCRNSEVAGVTVPMYLRYRQYAPWFLMYFAQQLAVCAVCIASLVPPLWPWPFALVFLAGMVWSRKAFVHVRNWRLIWVPFFSFITMYFFTFYYLRGLLTHKTHYEFDNRMN